MSRSLVVCEQCRRHVRASESACPFCRTTRSSAIVLGAALALAACHNEPPPASPTMTPSPPTVAQPTPAEPTTAPPANTVAQPTTPTTPSTPTTTPTSPATPSTPAVIVPTTPERPLMRYGRAPTTPAAPTPPPRPQMRYGMAMPPSGTGDPT